MTDKQLAKYKSSSGDLFRIRWYGYGTGVRSVLERFDGTEWHELERNDEGGGTPSTKEEHLIEDKMKQKMELYVSVPDFELVEGPEIRKQ